MRTFQSFTALGTVGKDPDVKSTQSGRKVANFSIATEESYTDRQGVEQKIVDWHRVTAWGELANIVEAFLRKGTQCFVRGKVKTRSYDDQSGQKRYITEVQAEMIIPAPRPPKDGAAPTQQRTTNAAPGGYGPSGLPVGPDGEELPF